MNSSHPPETVPAQPAAADLQSAIASFKAAFNVVLVMLCVLTTALTIFLFRQVSMARRQVSEASDYVLNYQSVTEPSIARFVAQLQAYAVTNRDFAPILAKYASLTPQSGPGGLPLPPKE